MLMDGFLVVTDVLEPQRLFLPAALPVSASPVLSSVVAGGVLLPTDEIKKERNHLRRENASPDG